MIRLMINNFLKYSYGIIICVIIGLLAVFISSYIPLGAVTIAILIGILVGNVINLSDRFTLGIIFSEKKLLAIAIALMGVNLNFHVLEELGIKSIVLVIAAIAFTISSALVIGKLFSCNSKLALLLGIGNGVCGSSAIAATEKVVGANKEEVGLSVAIINLLGTAGIFILPFVAKFILRFDDTHTGILIGNTLQAVGQVVASGFSVSHFAGHVATIIKMTRILMLFPLVFILIFSFSANTKGNTESMKLNKIPVFIVGFILFSLVPSFDLLDQNKIEILQKLSHNLLIVAMAAIGLKITFASISKHDGLALKTGSLIFLVQIIFSSLVIYFLF